MVHKAAPVNSRYVPFVQQPYCCVPACIQMVLYKNGMKLLSQETIGAELGLVVPPDVSRAFYSVEVHEEAPVGSGYGTRIQLPEFSLDNLIKKQNWRFKFEALLASQLNDVKEFVDKLKQIEAENIDALVCFQNDHGTGHVCVFDRVINEEVRLIDPSQDYPKWRTMKSQELLNRVKAHGDSNYGGLWILK